MSATIHTLHGEIQPPDRQRSYFEHIHAVAMANLRIQCLKVAARRFAEIIIDDSLKSGNSYLAGEANAFLEFMQTMEGTGK